MLYYLSQYTLWVTVMSLFVSTKVNGQTITHPASGTTSTTITCGSSYTYYDPGGTGNYSSSQLGTLTIDPSAAGQFVSLDFSAGPFDIEPNGGGCYDFIRIYDGTTTSDPLIGTYCNSNVPGVITSSTGSLTILFDSDVSVVGTGWVATATCSATPGPFIHPSSGTTSATINCGSTYTYYDPGGTGNYGNNQLGTYTFNPSVGGQYVEIDFTVGAFDVEPNGGGCYDFIRIYDGTSAADPLIGTYCNSNVPGTITSSTGSLTVVFDSDGGTVGSGWVAQISCSATPGPPSPITHPASGTTSTTIACGATTTYYDPGGTGNYGNSQLGTLTLNPSSAGQMVQIDFGAGAFDVEPNGGGCYDFLSIYDGTTTSDPLIGTYCNSNVPGVITSTTGSLTILFDTDAFTVGTGWVANVTCITPCATNAGTASATPNSLCPSGNATLSLAGEDGGATIQWQVSTDGGTTWSNIPGATTDPWVQNVTVNSSFQALVTNGCTSTSNAVAVSVGCPAIIQPTSGTASATATCGATIDFYDSGDLGGAYGDDENGLITICPSSAGQYTRVNFTSFSLENNFDYLYVFDGNDGSAPLLGIYTGTTLSGNITATSANSSGCLSFRFVSDAFTTSSGWDAEVTCVATAGTPAASPGVEDCIGAITICSNASLIGGTTGPGMDELPDEWNYCIDGGETQSNWYAFSPQTSGTVGFEIVPNSPTDYDWAIWGPYSSILCPAFTNDPPTRCSSTQLLGNGNTGLVSPATDTIEQNGEYGGGANENGFLAPLTVNAGEVYVLMLDNWSGSSVGFQINWSLGGGATLDCTVLPIELLRFSSQCDQDRTVLSWVTATETDNDYFIIEKADENFVFHEIGTVAGSGTSSFQHEYTFTDPEVNDQTGYYRLSQVDFDGTVHRHEVIASNCQNVEFEVVSASLANDNLDLLITTSTNEHLNINLYNIAGQLVASRNHEINAGNNRVSLQNLGLSSGTYFLSISGQFNAYSKKLMLVR